MFLDVKMAFFCFVFFFVSFSSVSCIDQSNCSNVLMAALACCTYLALTQSFVLDETIDCFSLYYMATFIHTRIGSVLFTHALVSTTPIQSSVFRSRITDEPSHLPSLFHKK